MPLYDCMLLLKPHVKKDMLTDLVTRVAKHVYSRKGVLTDIKSFGTIQLGYGIRKRDGRFYEGQFMQMTMMVPPNFPQELHYLNREDRLLRWLVAKHRGVKYGLDLLGDDYKSSESRHRFSISGVDTDDEKNDDEDDDDDDIEEYVGEAEDADNLEDRK